MFDNAAHHCAEHSLSACKATSHQCQGALSFPACVHTGPISCKVELKDLPTKLGVDIFNCAARLANVAMLLVTRGDCQMHGAASTMLAISRSLCCGSEPIPLHKSTSSFRYGTSHLQRCLQQGRRPHPPLRLRAIEIAWALRAPVSPSLHGGRRCQPRRPGTGLLRRPPAAVAAAAQADRGAKPGEAPRLRCVPGAAGEHGEGRRPSADRQQRLASPLESQP